MKYALAIAALFLVVLALRLVVSYQVAQPGYASYFTLAQADAIRATGHPRYEDPYSYEGRRYALNPVFYYVVAACTLILPKLLVVKLLPNLLLALLVPLVYLLSHGLTRSRGVSFAAAFFAGFAPILFTSFLNEAIPMSLALPVAAALLLALLDLEHHRTRALLLTALLALLSPIVWLFLAMYAAYALILTAERLRISAAYLELGLFTFFLAAWYTLITYKHAFQLYGFGILQGSLPTAARAAAFSEFTLLAMVLAMGIVPLALGSIALYHAAFEKRSRNVLLIASFGLVTLLLGAVSAIPLRQAFLLLSLSFIILAAPGLQILEGYIRKTRASAVYPWAAGLLVLFFVFTSMLPGLAAGVYPQSSPTPSELQAMTWLRERTPPSSVVLGAPKSGYLLNYLAHRPYVVDEQYLLISNPDAVLSDVDTIYTTPSTVQAVELLGKHAVSYILVGPAENARYRQYGAVLSDKTCFPIVYQDPQVLILRRTCGLRGSP